MLIAHMSIYELLFVDVISPLSVSFHVLTHTIMFPMHAEQQSRYS